MEKEDSEKTKRQSEMNENTKKKWKARYIIKKRVKMVMEQQIFMRCDRRPILLFKNRPNKNKQYLITVTTTFSWPYL